MSTNFNPDIEVARAGLRSDPVSPQEAISEPTDTVEGERVGENRFGRMSASEAGKKSVEVRRANKAAREAAADDPHAQRRLALERKAKQGDVLANRELRENHAYYYGTQRQDIWELLTPAQRGVVRGWLLDTPA